MENFNYDQFKLTVFAHDYYMIYLGNIDSYPLDAQKTLLEDFGYKNYLDIKGRPLKIAPVIRLFGTSDLGQKCCLHVHGFFPYFYVKAEDIKDHITPEFLLGLAINLEKCYILAYGNPLLKRSNKYAEEFQNEVNKNAEVRGYIIHSIEVVERYDIYCYHSKPEKFLKIKVYDAKCVKPLSKILSHPIILSRRFQTYEVIVLIYQH